MKHGNWDLSTSKEQLGECFQEANDPPTCMYDAFRGQKRVLELLDLEL